MPDPAHAQNGPGIPAGSCDRRPTDRAPEPDEWIEQVGKGTAHLQAHVSVATMLRLRSYANLSASANASSIDSPLIIELQSGRRRPGDSLPDSDPRTDDSSDERSFQLLEWADSVRPILAREGRTRVQRRPRGSWGEALGRCQSLAFARCRKRKSLLPQWGTGDDPALLRRVLLRLTSCTCHRPVWMKAVTSVEREPLAPSVVQRSRDPCFAACGANVARLIGPLPDMETETAHLIFECHRQSSQAVLPLPGDSAPVTLFSPPTSIHHL